MGMCLVTFDWNKNDARVKFDKFKDKKSIYWSVVELTEACNFNCIWCYANAGQKLMGKHMPLEDAKRIVDILSEGGVKQVTCSGGEPLMYPSIKEFVSYAHEKGMIVHMTTNGYLLTKELAAELKSRGLSQVQINIDGLDSTRHDRTRGKEGSYERAIRALNAAREVGMTCVSQTVLTKENETEIYDIIRFARSMGMQRCRVWDITPSEGRALEKIDMRGTNYVEMLKRISEFAKAEGGCNVESCDPLFPLDYTVDGLTVSGISCAAASAFLAHIAPNGDVLYCATHRKKLYNIFELESGKNLGRIHKEAVEAYKNTVSLPKRCASCGMLEKCNAGCMTRRIHGGSNGDYWCKRNLEQKVEVRPASFQRRNSA